MKEFPDLDLRQMIYLALAGLRPQRKDGKLMSKQGRTLTTTYFTPDEIYNWIRERGSTHTRGSFDNALSSIRNNKNNSNSFELTAGGETKKIPEVVVCSSRHGNKYCLSPQTVENKFSAKLVRRIGEEAASAANKLSKKLEKEIIKEIFEEFRDDYLLANEEDVLEKINDAIECLYFTRDTKGRLCPTERYLSDENDFISLLSESLPEAIISLPTDRKKTKSKGKIQ